MAASKKNPPIPIEDAFKSSHGTCAECRWWEPNDDKDAGFCHRYPPSIVTDDEGTATLFVITEPSDWCGEISGRN